MVHSTLLKRILVECFVSHLLHLIGMHSGYESECDWHEATTVVFKLGEGFFSKDSGEVGAVVNKV